MRWDQGYESPDVLDQRGASGGGVGGAGLIWLVFMLLRSPLGWVGAMLAIGAFLALGGLRYLTSSEQRQAGQTAVDGRPAQGKDAELVQFVSFVLDDTQSTWRKEFAEHGLQYRNAKLVLFTGRTPEATGCGYGSAASGPFYCPRDQRVYLDLSFFRELERRFGAPGDFAQAYVIAHEVGHHVQNLLGTSDKVHRSSLAEREGETGLSVRLELQADCFAGVWANATKHRNLLEAGDIEEGLRAAAAIGDDRLQRQAKGTVEPESFTHGSSEQRARWFKRGYDQGSPEACNTFKARAL
jgi:uncharacterized protein